MMEAKAPEIIPMMADAVKIGNPHWPKNEILDFVSRICPKRVYLHGYGKKIHGASAIPRAARSLSVLDASTSGKVSVIVKITHTTIPTIVPIKIGNNRKQ